MTLRELQKAIDTAIERAGDCDPDIEVWYKKKMHRIEHVGQFSIVPTVTITIGPKELDLT
jgi:hypothetical protein